MTDSIPDRTGNTAAARDRAGAGAGRPAGRARRARARSRGGAACLPPAPRQRRLSGPDVFRRLSLSGHPIYMCRELSSVRVLSSLSDTRRVSLSALVSSTTQPSPLLLVRLQNQGRPSLTAHAGLSVASCGHEVLANKSAQGIPHSSKKGPSGVFVRTPSRLGGSLRYSA